MNRAARWTVIGGLVCGLIAGMTGCALPDRRIHSPFEHQAPAAAESAAASPAENTTAEAEAGAALVQAIAELRALDTDGALALAGEYVEGDVPVALGGMLSAALSQLSCTTTGAKIDGNTAIVSAEITAVNSRALFTALTLQAAAYAMSADTENTAADFAAYIGARIDCAKLDTVTTACDVRMSRAGDGRWSVHLDAAENLALVGAISGGALETFEQIAGLLESIDGNS